MEFKIDSETGRVHISQIDFQSARAIYDCCKGAHALEYRGLADTDRWVGELWNEFFKVPLKLIPLVELEITSNPGALKRANDGIRALNSHQVEAEWLKVRNTVCEIDDLEPNEIRLAWDALTNPWNKSLSLEFDLLGAWVQLFEEINASL